MACLGKGYFFTKLQYLGLVLTENKIADIFDMVQKIAFVFENVENRMGKGENADQ